MMMEKKLLRADACLLERQHLPIPDLSYRLIFSEIGSLTSMMASQGILESGLHMKGLPASNYHLISSLMKSILISMTNPEKCSQHPLPLAYSLSAYTKAKTFRSPMNSIIDKCGKTTRDGPTADQLVLCRQDPKQGRNYIGTYDGSATEHTRTTSRQH
jgi:hypothetical protein